MSYILDALKKADSERQHGKTPDIYSHQPNNDTLEKEESAWSKPIIWFLLIAVIMLLVAVIFFNSGPHTQPAVILTPAQVAPLPITTAVPIAPTVQNAPTSPTPVAEAVMAAQPATPPAPPIAAVESPAPVVAASAEPIKLQPSPKLTIPASTEKHEKHHASASASSATKKTSLTKETDLAVETVSTTFRDLPLNIQNEIPTVTVGGYIYSAKREECQLLINKLILHEGEQVAPGLMLERMMPHSAILNYKGYRYRISY
ncbi:MAG TPA: general secretion pathway protein GspB [Burkholderiaceae bacterium]|jgi:general secretion pathway protein B